MSPALRLKRFSAAFGELEARARLSESSGSKRSAAGVEEESSSDLSELVDSFLERGCGVEEEGCGEKEMSTTTTTTRKESERYGEECEMKRMLMSLIGGDAEEEEDGGVRQMICAETESGRRSLGSGEEEEEVKRRVMSRLRLKGFDAGLCKYRWDKTTQSPAGEHEYIDIVEAGTRYIIDTSPTAQFTIARPTDHYASLLQLFPPILVCKEEELKTLVTLMCTAMRQSLKTREMHVPPWRRDAYVQAKWFGPYKRTTNIVPATDVASGGGDLAGRSSVGFGTLQGHITSRHVCCRVDVGLGLLGENLNAALEGMHL
ncbi:hypothetical protein Vadar_018318 [Vaccinium darrowii]|uniref:Uncharacterized protein n=1 Tax=Vaccinium darrowii TaxID=229202 RepID=A0ACB7Z4V8_9ERIC|nr:hypothetical protein Vadar_018318 [Vaccinium darrowii]